MDKIEQELRQFIIDNFLYGEGGEQLSNSDSFLEKGLVDSMGVLTLVSHVQDKYGINVGDEELIPENWDSIRQITDFVQAKLGVAK